MPSITLTNPNLKKLIDINQNPYYLLVDSNNSDERSQFEEQRSQTEGQAYFCFPKTVVAG
jgi:hypothetical protein